MAKRQAAAAVEDGILLVASNKKARRDYEIVEVLEAGLVLSGSEVKSVRAAAVSLKESYIRIRDDEAFLIGANISRYSHSRPDAHEPDRDRKLLLHRREIDRLRGQVMQKGLTIVPLRIYFRKGRCKVEIGVGRGRKLYDKRDATRAKEAQRQMERGVERHRERGR